MKPNPTMQPCTSSQIKALGHCAATNTLRVEFKSGGVYDYQGVPAEKFTALTAAESAGKHLQQHIKPHHAFTKLS
ncbi:MAG: KTSC domain-containing protein [Sulfuriferula sp.]